MPKRVSEDERRVPLNCLVLPETRRWLRGQGGSQGELVDRAVAALRVQEAQGRVQPKGGLTEAAAIGAVPERLVPAARQFRAPLLKPSEKNK